MGKSLVTTLMSDVIVRRTQEEGGGEDRMGKDWWACQVDPPPGLGREPRRRKGL